MIKGDSLLSYQEYVMGKQIKGSFSVGKHDQGMCLIMFILMFAATVPLRDPNTMFRW